MICIGGGGERREGRGERREESGERREERGEWGPWTRRPNSVVELVR